MLALLVATGVLPLPPAEALPPGGTDVFNVSAQVDVKSRLGSETFSLSGTAVIARGDPHMEGGVEVAGLELTELNLTGNSMIGAVSVSESASQVSSGELRSLQPPPDQFPASSFIDAFVLVSAPANPSATLLLHNQTALHLIPRQGPNEVSLNAWPPTGVTFALQPIFGVDNDGDTQVDEDTADEDGDGLIDEDRPGMDPGCSSDCDTDGLEGEDPPASLCPAATPGAPTLCDPDGDGQIDEDPACIPLLNPANTHLKYGVCITDVRITIDSSKTPIAGTPTKTPTGTITPPAPTNTLAPPTATATPERVGDANCSGTVNALDATIVLQKSARLIGAVPCPPQGDANGDGRVDALDATLILQFVARLIGHLPP